MGNHSSVAIVLRATPFLPLAEAATDLDHQQSWIFQQVPQFLKIFGAERAVDDAMVAAHRDRHTVTDHHLIAVVNDWDLCDLAHGENEALRWINDSRETVDAHSAEI